jgi:glycosyltransferase
MNSESKLLSIITICKNSSLTVGQTLKSVVEQQDIDTSQIEHLVVDGASTDRTVEIASQFPHIRLISEADRGISDAFNRGIKNSSGEWIMFLNSNDKLHDSMVLADILPILRSVAADVVYGRISVVDPSNNMVLREAGRDRAWEYLHQRMTIPHPATITRRCYFERFGLFDENFKIAMDYEILLRGLGPNGTTTKYKFFPRLINSFSSGGASLSGGRAWFHASEVLRAKKKNKVGTKFSQMFWYFYQGTRWTWESWAQKIPLFKKFHSYLCRLIDRGY